MPNPNLPPDDQAPTELSASDRALRRLLDDTLTQRFEQQCDPFLQELLSHCDWYVTTYAHVVTLVIACPDLSTNWQMLHHVAYFGTPMEQFSQDAKIRIYPPVGTGEPFEIRVDELSIYRENGNGG